MTLVRWQPMTARNPFEGFAAFQCRMNRLFDEAFQSETEAGPAVWSPRVDVTEFDDRFEVSAELPGMVAEEVKVELDNNILSLSGEKRAEEERKDRDLYVAERRFGGFRRSFQFPTHLDASKIDASFRNGVLTITLPKVEAAKPKQIEIKVH